MSGGGTIRTIGLLGGGVIGAGWAARAVLNGLDAVICDPDPEAARRIAAVIDNARTALSRLTLAPLPAAGTWRVVRRVEEAAEAADFMQESLPEREDLKIALLAQAERAMREGVVIASSTAGLKPTRLQSGLRRPERLVVGHPFNPVYLLPLVEVCGGAATDAAACRRAAEFYRGLGMHPLLLRRETDGFIADRLMEALWREALFLIRDDVATAAEIDDAIRFGPGLRWAFMGPFLTSRLAGGEQAQSGPAPKWPRTRMTDVPDLDDASLERLRDSCLVGILQTLKANRIAGGAVLAEYEAALWQAQAATARHMSQAAAPLHAFAGRIEPGWIDYNGHLTESRYLQIFSHASDAMLALIGADTAYVARGHSFYTAETHLRHLAQMHGDEAFYATVQVLGADAKRVHIWQELHRDADGAVTATCEQMLLHVDAATGRACPALAEVRAGLDPLVAAHAALPRPEAAGRAIRLNQRG